MNTASRSVVQDLRAWVWLPVSVAILSRLYSTLLLAQYSNHAALPMLGFGTSPFVAWDAQWYLHIAATGYHAAPQQGDLATGHHDFAFYPGWPIFIRIASLGGLLPIDLVAVVLANLLFVVALVVIYRVFVDRFGEQTAYWAALLLAFNPAGYVLSMAYSEPLFLLAAGLYFASRYNRASPVLAALSVLARLAGLAIGASAAVMFLLHQRARARLLLICLAVAAAFAAWWVFIWELTGSVSGWFEGSAEWGHYEGIVSILREVARQAPSEALWFAFVAIMAVGTLLLMRDHPDLAIYGLVAIGLSLVGAPAWSMPRHAMVAFPAFAGLARRLGPRLSFVVALGFALVEVAFVDFAFGPIHRPP
jgi:Mannosyltransferase (PIG-V)